uniref:THAP-type domain-containing protein n=1 Tax=Ascaris lumbricoides TaxID=6252 RepID=A0A0M3IV83_ASCLU
MTKRVSCSSSTNVSSNTQTKFTRHSGIWLYFISSGSKCSRIGDNNEGRALICTVHFHQRKQRKHIGRCGNLHS